MKDILLFISDQHSYNLQHYAGNPIIRTPALDMLAKKGTAMTDTMTSCPLCVPARMSLISGKLPSRTGVMDNLSNFHSGQATFLHCLNATGYETVLCGRMHFVGIDQRHGFSRRIAKEMTNIFLNPVPGLQKRYGPFNGFADGICVQYMGPGDSPVLEYDRYVVHAAEEYLKQNYDRPQFITVGTYSPHFPYTAPTELFDYYYDKVTLDEDTYNADEHPALKSRFRDTAPEVVRAARAAYYGLVEFTDQNIGRVYKAFQAYLRRTGHEGVFLYVSDHGDLNGYRGYYAKTNFYDPSVHIPLIICGDGIPAGEKIINPTSIMDIGPTLCELAGAQQPYDQEGKSLISQIMDGTDDSDRMVFSEQLNGWNGCGEMCLGRMVKWRNWKYFTYDGYPDHDRLYDCIADPKELRNVAAEYPDILEKLRAALNPLTGCAAVYDKVAWFRKNNDIMRKCSYTSDEQWSAPSSSVVPLERVYSSKQKITFPILDDQKNQLKQ